MVRMSLTTCLEVLVVAVLTLALTPISGLGSESNGLGDHIEWLPLEDGLELAKKENKPLMLIIHKSWCGACKAMKPKFVESDEIAALSKKFVMVNTMDDDEPEGEIYQPDGGYIPRLLFFEPSGDLLKDIINESGNPKYKYYYSDADAITRSMKTVLKQYSSDEPLEDATVEVESDESVQKNGTERIEL